MMNLLSVTHKITSTSIILGCITDVTAHSANVQTDTEQQNSTTSSTKLKLYSAVASHFSLPKSRKIIYPEVVDACGIHITSVETLKYF